MTSDRKSMWPTGVVVGMLLAIAGLFYAVSFLIRNPVELVREDYYDAGLVHRQKMEALAATDVLEKKPKIFFDAQFLKVSLPADWAADASNVVIHIYRPDDASQDLTSRPGKIAESVQIDFTDRPRGRWDVLLEWYMQDVHYMSEEDLHLK